MNKFKMINNKLKYNRKIKFDYSIYIDNKEHKCIFNSI